MKPPAQLVKKGIGNYYLHGKLLSTPLPCPSVLTPPFLRQNKCQKRPTIGAKETYYRGKRDLL